LRVPPIGKSSSCRYVSDGHAGREQAGLARVEGVAPDRFVRCRQYGTKTDNMVIGVVLPLVRRGAQRACKELGSRCCGDGGGFLGGVVSNCPVTFMHPETCGAFKYLLRKTHGGILPDRRVIRPAPQLSLKMK